MDSARKQGLARLKRSGTNRMVSFIGGSADFREKHFGVLFRDFQKAVHRSSWCVPLLPHRHGSLSIAAITPLSTRFISGVRFSRTFLR